MINREDVIFLVSMWWALMFRGDSFSLRLGREVVFTAGAGRGNRFGSVVWGDWAFSPGGLGFRKPG